MDAFDSDSDSDIEVLHMRRRRTYRPRINMQLDNFRERFRLSRGQFDAVLTSVGPTLQHSSGRSAALTPSEQLLVTLRFLATGAFYNVIGDSHGIAKASVCPQLNVVSTPSMPPCFGSTSPFQTTLPSQRNSLTSLGCHQWRAASMARTSRSKPRRMTNHSM